jgi:hypothetical protein
VFGFYQIADDFLDQIRAALKRAFKVEVDGKPKAKQFHDQAPDEARGGVPGWVGEYAVKTGGVLSPSGRRFYKVSRSITVAAKTILTEFVLEHGSDRAMKILDQIHRDHRDYRLEGQAARRFRRRHGWSRSDL